MSDPVLIMSHLIACMGCQRHVRSSDSSCPFCGDVLPSSLRRSATPRVPTGRLGRAALFAFGTALAAATGCGESHSDDGGTDVDASADAGFDAGLIMAAYGGPPDAGSVDDAAAPDDAGFDAGVDAGEIFPPYGAPPADGAPII